MPYFARRSKTFLDAFASIAMIGAAATLIWVNLHRPAGLRSATPLAVPAVPLSLTGAALRGQPAAQVGILEFSDFQCPYCGVFARDVLPTIEREYVDTGRVVFAFRHLPLAAVHPYAVRAAQGASCAARQGRFWEMHDSLFHVNSRLDDRLVEEVANSIGIVSEQFAACMNDDPSGVRADQAEAARLGVASTPTFFVGAMLPDGRLKPVSAITGAKSIADFRAAIDTALKSGGAKRSRP